MNRFRTVLIIFLSLTVVAAIAFVVWARSVHGPEPIAYESAMANPSIVIERRNGFITIRPRSTHPTVGLLFYPGARVAPEAYISKLAAISIAANIQIAIGRPRLNLAVLSIEQADEMRGTLSGVTRWYVGGHSLGGAMACLYASRHAARLEGVVLLGTYCGSDISKTKLRVLSVTGGSDGVFPPSKISRARGELPSGARAVQVPGMNHAEFGNYGPQPGDNAASISDAVARDKLSEEAKSFYSEPNGVD